MSVFNSDKPQCTNITLVGRLCSNQCSEQAGKKYNRQTKRMEGLCDNHWAIMCDKKQWYKYMSREANTIADNKGITFTRRSTVNYKDLAIELGINSEFGHRHFHKSVYSDETRRARSYISDLDRIAIDGHNYRADIEGKALLASTRSEFSGDDDSRDFNSEYEDDESSSDKASSSEESSSDSSSIDFNELLSDRIDRCATLQTIVIDMSEESFVDSLITPPVVKRYRLKRKATSDDNPRSLKRRRIQLHKD